jgi:uncharacterized membrane protein
MKESTKKMLNYFLIGIFAVIPIVIVLEIIIFVKDRLIDTFGFVYGYADSYFYTIVFFIISFFMLVWIGRGIVKKGRPMIITAFEHVIERLPFFNTIYRVLKKVIAMFTSHDQTIAKEVVYVEFPKTGIMMLGYVTNRHEDKYVVFIPTSPNPTSGFTVIADKSKVYHSKMDIEAATSFIVSVGVDYETPEEMSSLPG